MNQYLIFINNPDFKPFLNISSQPSKIAKFVEPNFPMFETREIVYTADDYGASNEDLKFQDITAATFSSRYHIILYHVILCHIIDWSIILLHTMSCHRLVYHIISCHTLSYHIISNHIILYHIMSQASSFDILFFIPKSIPAFSASS